jgi:hypothetical protein
MLAVVCRLVVADEPPPSAAELDELKARIDTLEAQVVALQPVAPAPAVPAGRALAPRLLIRGEGAVAFFDTPDGGAFPNSEFRVDEARLFLEAQLLDRAFLFSELNLYQREDMNTDVNVGELYVDIEGGEQLWGGGGSLTARAGRFDIPFGEEYRTRDAIDNPMISHSISDIWGVDEGVELYGVGGPLDAVLAVQNGGNHKIDDGDPDKAVVARIGWQPVGPLRISASAMRTGDLSVQKDESGELWFANEFLRPLGGPETTSTFHAELAQLDARLTWARGYVGGHVGGLCYDDDDTARDNTRDVLYWSVEGVQTVVSKLYAAARFSALSCPDGFAVTGQGAYERDAWAARAEDLWRLSLGAGWRWSPQLVLKGEYSFERGERPDGRDIEDQDQVAAQLAFGF